MVLCREVRWREQSRPKTRSFDPPRNVFSAPDAGGLSRLAPGTEVTVLTHLSNNVKSNHNVGSNYEPNKRLRVRNHS